MKECIKKLNCELEEILISAECSKNLTKFKNLVKFNSK